MIDWQSKVIGPTVKVFGQPATYTQDGVAYPSLSGVFDEAYTFVDVADGVPVSTVAPCFGFNALDLPVNPRQRDRITVFAAAGAPSSDTEYIVKNVQPDGHGWIRLMLNAAPVRRDMPARNVQDV